MERARQVRARQKDQAKRRNEGGKTSGVLDTGKVEGNVTFYKLKKGKQSLDVIPFEVTSKHHPQGFKKDDIDYKLDIFVHNNVGANNEKVVCLQHTFGKPCPICEDRQQLMDAGAEWDDEEVKALKSKRRCYYNVIDLDEQDKGIQLLDISFYWFEKEVYEEAESAGPEFSCFADLEEGYTIEFRGAEEKFKGKPLIKPKSYGFVERDAYDEEILDKVFPLDAMLKVPTYEEVQSMYLGMEAESEEEEEEKEEPARKRKAKVVEVEEEQEEVEEEVDEDLDDIPVCPYGHIIGKDHKCKEECDECEDDDFEACAEIAEQLVEEEEEKPKPRRRRAAKVEEKVEEPKKTRRTFKNKNR